MTTFPSRRTQSTVVDRIFSALSLVLCKPYSSLWEWEIGMLEFRGKIDARRRFRAAAGGLLQARFRRALLNGDG